MTEASGSINITPQTNYTQFEIDSGAQNVQQKQKGKWSFSFEFVLAGLGYTLTYTNIWRLFYIMYRHGGVLFLFPYVSCIVLVCVPMFYLETCLGQFWGKGPLHIWKFCPLFRGVGASLIIMNAIWVMYTNPFQSWFVYYGAISLSKVLPWTSCSNHWNTDKCAVNSTDYSSSLPADEYFQRGVLQLSSGIDDLGSMRGELVGCMFAVTVLMFLALFWGVRLTGKILLVTVPLPLVIMFILFIRGVSLQGGTEGLLYLLYPNFQSLTGTDMWRGAFTQAIYTTGVSTGVVHTLASYNHFKTPCLRYSFTVCIVNMLVGVLSSLMVMSLIGALANTRGLSVDQVINAGPDLVFIIIPDVLSSIPAANLWCFIFFLMLFLLGITKQFLAIEVFVKTVMDIIPRTNHIWRILVVASVCFVSFILTLPFLTQGGVYLITLFDWYSWKITLPFFVILECITVAWIYGLDQFSADIKMMTGLRPPIVFKFLWAFIIPILILIWFIYMETIHRPVSYGYYVFPEWADRVGYFLAVIPLFAVPVFAIISIVRASRSSPLHPPWDCRPDTDQWPEYDANQRHMKRSFLANLRGIFRT